MTALNPPGIEISSNRNTTKLAAAVVATIRPSSGIKVRITALTSAAGRECRVDRTLLSPDDPDMAGARAVDSITRAADAPGVALAVLF